MVSNGTMILCDNLVKIYKVQDLEVVALQGLDLLIDQGEFVGIVGPSGSGKSSLLNILGGLDRQTAGKAIVDGQDLLKLSNAALTKYRRKKVGFLWQQPSRNLIPYLTVMDNVELPMLLAGRPADEREEWARELLENVSLWERRDHAVHQLSGGEQQRTAIAVALANKPVILLADEPTGEVDTATAQQILSTLRYLNETYDLTLIVVTHDVRISDQVDRVVSIRDGRTSSERFRRVHGVMPSLPSDDDDNGEGDTEQVPTHEVTYHEFVVVDAAGRLQLPKEYLDEVGIRGRAEVQLTEEGILVTAPKVMAEVGSHSERAAAALDLWETDERARSVSNRVLRAGQHLWESITKRK